MTICLGCRKKIRASNGNCRHCASGGEESARMRKHPLQRTMPVAVAARGKGKQKLRKSGRDQP